MHKERELRECLAKNIPNPTDHHKKHGHIEGAGGDRKIPNTQKQHNGVSKVLRDQRHFCGTSAW